MIQGRSRSQLAYRGMKGPAWRSELAEQLAGSQEAVITTRYDDLTQEAIAYHCRRRSGPDDQRRADEQYPQLAAAYGLWDNDAVAESFRILVLANCSQEEIADRLQIGTQTVCVMEGLFFDIRWALDASDWIICHVIIPEKQNDTWDVVAKLRLAYFGGPVMARAILDARARLPFDGAEQLFDREVLLHVKLQEALEAPLSDGEQMEYLKLYMDYEIKRQRLELDKKKFAHECGRDEHRGAPASQSQETEAGESEDGSESGHALQEGDGPPVVARDLWRRLIA